MFFVENLPQFIHKNRVTETKNHRKHEFFAPQHQIAPEIVQKSEISSESNRIDPYAQNPMNAGMQRAYTGIK
jgi:hypothetical protein